MTAGGGPSRPDGPPRARLSSSGSAQPPYTRVSSQKRRSRLRYVASVADPDNEVTADLIAQLLREQHPDLAGLPLRFGARGWDNQLWRLGDDLAVRLPWATQSADELLLKEHTLLPAIAPRLPLQVPVPQRLGQPSERFPRPWIVTTWVAGEPADRV